VVSTAWYAMVRQNTARSYAFTTPVLINITLDAPRELKVGYHPTIPLQHIRHTLFLLLSLCVYLCVLKEEPCPLHLLHFSNALLQVTDEALLVVVGAAGQGGRNFTGVLGLQLYAKLVVLGAEDGDT